MKLDLEKIFFLILFLTLSVMAATAGTIKGTITDRQTKEPLTGATIQDEPKPRQGVIADLDGHYSTRAVKPGNLYPRSSAMWATRTSGWITCHGRQHSEIVLNFEMEQ